MVGLRNDRKTCSECGAPMRERRQWQQDEALYTWMECTREECPAKTLVKTDMGDGPGLRRLRPVTRAAMLM